MNDELSLEEIDRIDKATKKTNLGEERYGIFTYTCPVCDKNFGMSNNVHWAYRRRRYFGKKIALLTFCTYTCMRKFDRAIGT